MCGDKPYLDAKVQKWLPSEAFDALTARSHDYITTDANGKFEFT
ncbi:unnamed protein product [Nippostrongylus brasiliensis]|uniref:Glutamine synthetase n=1 Tax=Nippostrongylus brasiliensis TaxID=27835 RepID=A0A0N4XJM8_NIPBR|nr:unnamed protein product [Nippostrongylus brasiliensis]